MKTIKFRAKTKNGEWIRYDNQAIFEAYAK